jgi:TolA-binding protein
MARQVLGQIAASGGPASFEASHWIARCLLKERQPEKALALVEGVLARAGQTTWAAQLLMDQADALYEIPGRRAESATLYAALASKYPQDPIAPQALYMAGFAALEAGDAAGALKHATAFLQAYRGHALVPDVTHVAAESHMQLGQFAEAASRYATLLEKYADHADAELWKVRRVVALFAQKRYAETIAALEPLVGTLRSPDTRAEAHYLIGSSQLELKQYEAAVKSLEASLAAQPKWRQADETLLALAQAHRHANDLGKAKAAIERFLAEYPNSRLADRAHYRLGECAMLGGQFDLAATEFGRVLSGWPSSPLAPHAMHELGCAELNRKNPAAAETVLGTLVERFPQHVLIPRARYARAMARHQLSRFGPAVDDLQAAIAKLESKDRSDARFLLGLCQMEMKQFAAAAATFSSLLKDDPAYSGADKARYQWAWAMKLQGQQAEAVKQFEQLATAHPTSPLVGEAWYNIGEFAYANQDYAAAAKSYYAALEKEDGTPLGEKAGHKLGWCYYHQQNYPNAQKTFAYQRQRYPNGPLAADGQFMEAECLFKQGSYGDALKAYEALPALDNKEFQALALLHAGQAAAQLKQWEKGLKHLARGVDQFPDSAVIPELLCELGWVHQNLGHLTEAVDHYERTIAKTDQVGRANSESAARAQFLIGEVQFQNKEHAEAVKSFFKVAYGYSYPTWQANATYEAARCFEVLGKKTQAAKMYQELVEKYPQSDKVSLAKQRLGELKP